MPELKPKNLGETQLEQNEQLLAQSELNVLLVEGYYAALDLDPRLANMKIVPITEETHKLAYASPNWAKTNTGGQHEIHIRLGSLDEEMKHLNNVMSQIPAGFNKMLERLGVSPEDATPELLYAFTVFHEMGHVSQYFDNEADPTAYIAATKKERLTLPIAKATTSAIINPDTPIRKAIDEQWPIVSEQLGVRSLEELVTLQAIAYRNLPKEADADRFAVDVFRSNPLLLDRLMSPNLKASLEYSAIA
jgi:hypothetical protein